MAATADDVGGVDSEKDIAEGLAVLRSYLEKKGIQRSPFEPGNYKGMICPKCGGGNPKEKRFSLFVRKDGQFAAWSCTAKCGWKGNVQASGESKSYFASEQRQHVMAIPQDKTYKVISEKELRLSPLGKEILQYFSSRGISRETLQRNAVMQRVVYNKVFIAFTYRRNGSLVSCKYRSTDKTFWQERKTERIFYGLDDIKQASDIIIVEGEIDKLTLNEVGYSNCVSVPDGAPEKVSEKLPSKDKDTQFEFVWNCEEYLFKASRIILATDGDIPGQALAEGLARRLGKERCWRVKWPDKNDAEVCKDANEVLMYLGRDALKEAIDNAEQYPLEVIENVEVSPT